MRSRQRYRRVSLILPSSISSRSSSVVEGYQRRSMASSLPGAQRRLIAINGLFEESIQFQPLPQLQSEKARTELTRSFQTHFVQQHTRYLWIVRRRRHMRGEELQLLSFTLLIENLNGCQPA